MSVQTLCTQLPDWAIIGSFLIYSVFEYFMGKTTFGSTISLIVEHPLQWLAQKILKQNQPTQKPPT